MSTPVVLNGITYNIPAYNDNFWAQGQGNLSSYLIALAGLVQSAPAFMQTQVVSSSPIAVTSVKTYLAQSNSLAITFNLPTPTVNTWFIVKDSGGNSETNAITIHRFAGESIDGLAADLTLTKNYGSWMFVSDGTNWFLVVTT